MIDLGFHAFDEFFKMSDEIGFVKEAARRGVSPVILFIADTDRVSTRGYATLLFHRGTRSARLYSIAVDQREQRKGIARHLLAAVEDEASRSHCTRVRLEVRSDNFPARSLYKSVGYEPFGIYPRYYLDGEDAIRMQRGLRAAQVMVAT